MRTAALILAAGKGRRMHSDTAKQFLNIGGKPLFMYSVERYLPCVDLVVLVTNEEGLPFVDETLRGAGLSDRVPVILGGKERYDSSYAGLRYLEKQGGYTHVLIHDAARCLITETIILDVLSDTVKYGAAVASFPSRDTVKLADDDGFSSYTPERSRVYVIQTPQGFELPLILNAYRSFYREDGASVTDDASVVEQFTDRRVRLSHGDEENVKVTTEADLPKIRMKLENN